jgi:hypothetical protein
MDNAFKRYTDSYRGSLPPELAHLEGHYIHPEQSLLNTLRGWDGMKVVYEMLVDRPTQVNPKRKVSHSLSLTGGIDELLMNEDGNIVNLDFKTKKDEPPEDYGKKFYQDTMDTYNWMLKQKGFPVADYAYLWYFWPLDVKSGATMEFGNKLLKLDVSTERTEDKLKEIGNGLPSIDMEAMSYRPKSGAECQYCEYVEKHFNHVGM